jgi:spore maturation protein CgeB
MSLKVLFLPIQYGDYKQKGFEDSFRKLGCDVVCFDYCGLWYETKNNNRVREKLFQVAKSFRPDIFFIQTHHLTIINFETLQKIKNELPCCKFCNWTDDIKNYILPNFLELSFSCDYNFASSTGQLKFLSEIIKKPVYYLPVGYDENIFFPSKENKNIFENDIVFIGNYTEKENFPGTKERLQACYLLKEKFGNRFKIYGSGWPTNIQTEGHCSLRKNNEVYRNSFCNISISHYNDISDYFSDRPLRGMASGRPTLIYRFPNWQNFFTDMSDAVLINSVEEIINKINILKKNPDLSEFIGKNGAAKALAEHTYTSRIKQLFNTIGIQL